MRSVRLEVYWRPELKTYDEGMTICSRGRTGRGQHERNPG